MGKQDVNVSAELEDIQNGAKLLLEAAAKKERSIAKTGGLNVPGDETKSPKSASPNNLPDDKSEAVSIRPKPKAKTTRPIPFPAKREERVNMSSKVLPIQKRRLKELALKRELFGLYPYKLQDLMEEALQYLFEKYEAETKKAANS